MIATPEQIAEAIARRIGGLAAPNPRNLIAIVGGPASGKSTVAHELCAHLNAAGTPTGLLAMDGFHLDNRILDTRGQRAIKGAPETFDLGGFTSTLERLRLGQEVIAPVFDRGLDLSVGAASLISGQMTTVVVEGNYLLLNEPGWRDLAAFWTLSVRIDVGPEVLEQRLMKRWLDHGLSRAVAQEKTHQNDLPNARRILAGSMQPDMVAGLSERAQA